MKNNISSEKTIERLPDSELNVMKVIWNNTVPIGTGKIIEILTKEKKWSRSTVQVLLSRLEDRGFIQCRKEGRLKYYIPLIEESAYRSKETKNFLEHFYNNSYKKLIASLVQDNAINEGDIEDIICIIKGENNKDK
jgi:predicted transcriptional regulator